MFKLPRARFLHLLCFELHRIESAILAALPGIYNGMQHEEGQNLNQIDILSLLTRSEKVSCMSMVTSQIGLIWLCTPCP